MTEPLSPPVGHTAGPWTWCDCPSNCGHIGSKDDHLATVTFGEWGNEYPVIQPENGSVLGGRYQVVMQKDAFGCVPIETAKANARLIAAAPCLLEALILARDHMVSEGSAIAEICDEAIAKASPPYEGGV